MLGRAIAVAAVERGHAVTCLARGSTPVPEGTTLISADRDDQNGLVPVAGRHWDAVIDVARQPGHGRRAIRDLSTSHWVFISSGNVYADFSTPEQDESEPVRAPLGSDVMADMSTYGWGRRRTPPPSTGGTARWPSLTAPSWRRSSTSPDSAHWSRVNHGRTPVGPVSGCRWTARPSVTSCRGSPPPRSCARSRATTAAWAPAGVA